MRNPKNLAIIHSVCAEYKNLAFLKRWSNSRQYWQQRVFDGQFAKCFWKECIEHRQDKYRFVSYAKYVVLGTVFPIFTLIFCNQKLKTVPQKVKKIQK